MTMSNAMSNVAQLRPRHDAERPAQRSLLELAVLNPERIFGRPELVLTDARFSRDDKRRVLEAWEADERRLLEAAEDRVTQPGHREASIAKPRPARLAEVQASLQRLYHTAS